MLEAIRRSMLGLGFAMLITFAALTVMMILDAQYPVAVIWKNTLGGMVMGIYFGVASLIFDHVHWSPLKKTVIHYLFSIIIWVPLAIYMGWIPFEVLFVLLGVGAFTVVYLLFWSGSYLYFKKLENEMNQSVKP